MIPCSNRSSASTDSFIEELEPSSLLKITQKISLMIFSPFHFSAIISPYSSHSSLTCLSHHRNSDYISIYWFSTWVRRSHESQSLVLIQVVRETSSVPGSSWLDSDCFELLIDDNNKLPLVVSHIDPVTNVISSFEPDSWDDDGCQPFTLKLHKHSVAFSRHRYVKIPEGASFIPVPPRKRKPNSTWHVLLSPTVKSRIAGFDVSLVRARGIIGIRNSQCTPNPDSFSMEMSKIKTIPNEKTRRNKMATLRYNFLPQFKAQRNKRCIERMNRHYMEVLKHIYSPLEVSNTSTPAYKKAMEAWLYLEKTGIRVVSLDIEGRALKIDNLLFGVPGSVGMTDHNGKIGLHELIKWPKEFLPTYWDQIFWQVWAGNRWNMLRISPWSVWKWQIYCSLPKSSFSTDSIAICEVYFSLSRTLKLQGIRFEILVPATMIVVQSSSRERWLSCFTARLLFASWWGNTGGKISLCHSRRLLHHASLPGQASMVTMKLLGVSAQLRLTIGYVVGDQFSPHLNLGLGRPL